MGNFDFLLKDKDYSDFAMACIDAENVYPISTVMTAISCRRALELAVKWLYKFDNDLKVPYKDNLSSLVNHYDFKAILDSPKLYQAIMYIIRLGNVSVHTNSFVKPEEASLALRNLFSFVNWIDYCYGDPGSFEEREFNYDFRKQNLHPKTQVTVEDSTRAKKELDKSEKPLKEIKEEESSEKQDILTEKRKTAGVRQEVDFRLDHISEKETRERFIDVELRLAGWNASNTLEEVKVEEMPNQSNKGYADYVLYGKNKLPLAVVEAKKASVEPDVGVQQAKLYADYFEKSTGQRPIVFTTNGFDTYIQVDDEPKRKVASFYTQDELQRLVDRRQLRQDLSDITINDDISNRYYQKAAITSVCEAFSKNRREALLVMATGSGKTRTAISLVDVLTKKNWVKNVLFLADRTSLVKQAYRAFNKLLPNLSLCNLLETSNRENDAQNSRMVFSTYPTMMNAIDNMVDEENRIFTVGHFDLIIIDESHRSIYQKYRAIFDYFDARVVGLTATPRNDIDKNTYSFFHIEDNVPTYAYDLEQAVEDKYLVSYKTIETQLKLPTDGLHFDDLSEEEKEQFDDTFEDSSESKDIDGSAFNDRIFNKKTIQIVLEELMEKGIKTASGDEVGKTIIFAKNHYHAIRIKELFDEFFPEKGADYAAVIDNQVKYNQSLIDTFSNKHKLPQIAISVDMLDTGIDVPEVVNLVFFKKVRSKIKFWQMIGRGTRLCDDLFGPGLNKKEFLIFDYGNNFDYFREERRDTSPALLPSLTARLFTIKVDIIMALQDLKNASEYSDYRNQLVEECYYAISMLNEDDFRVRLKLKSVLHYKDKKNWQLLTIDDLEKLKKDVAPLILPDKDDEMAKRFDLWIYCIELAMLTDTSSARYVKQVIKTAQTLQGLGTIPQVKNQAKIIEEVQKEEFWKDYSLEDLESIRLALRELLRYIPVSETKIYYTDFDDEIKESKHGEAILNVNDLRSYREKVEFYLKEHLEETAIYKLRHNQVLTKEDIQELERILWKELGSKEEYEQQYANKTIPRLIGEVVGMDKETVNDMFSSFLSDENLTSDQIDFIKLIIDYVTHKGFLDMRLLQEDPFKTVGSIAVVFKQDMSLAQNLIQKIKEVNAVFGGE